MLIDADHHHQTNFFGTDLLQQLDPSDGLILLADSIPWSHFDRAFSHHYSEPKLRHSVPVRTLTGLLILKQLENLSDENVVLQWKRNPYYQYFCGITVFQNKTPCHSTELFKFRKRIDASGVEDIFKMSVSLHGRAVEDATVNIDTTVQEKTLPIQRMES